MMRQAALALFCLTLPTTTALAERTAPVVGRIAVQRAERQAEGRRGGIIRHGFHVASRAVLSGLVGGGAGYFVGGPGVAMDWGVKAAGAGGALSSLLSSGKTGIYKHSNRAFAKATLAEARGQTIRKHYNKLKGIVWSGVECGAVNGLTTGGIGCVVSGPAGIVPSAVTGGLVGGAFGLASGTARAYVVPFFKRRSLGWSMSRARSALKQLAREPANPAWQAEATRRLQKVQSKKENLPRLGSGQTRRFNNLAQMAQQLGQRPGLAGLGSILR